MKKATLYCLVIILLCSMLASVRIGSDINKQLAIFKRIHKEELHNPKAAEALREITTSIGHRLTGSENGHKAEQYVYALFTKEGFKDVQFQEFEVEAWSREKVKVGIYYNGLDTTEIRTSGADRFPQKSDSGKAVCITAPEVVSLAHSPVLADVFAPLVDVGNGLQADFEKNKDRVKGKIVLLNIGIYPRDTSLKNLHRSEKTALAIRYGAAGCLFINTVEGRILLTGTASVNGQLISIPAACITLEDGQAIRQYGALSHKTWVRLTMSNKSGKIKARNIIASLKGSELPDEEILLCAHLDSWDLATGALDNGIGSFTMLEIARVFEKLHLQCRRTIRFIAFMGEEQGLLGSKAYLKESVTNGNINRIKYVINLDMDGNTSGFNASGRPEAEGFIKNVISQIQQVEPAFKGNFINRAGLHSDHQTFMEQGIPVLGSEGNLDRSVYRFYHSNKDDFNIVNPEHMSRCADFVGMMLYALAQTKILPASKLNDTETRDFFIRARLKEDLILGGEWRWEK
jgi:carboxypeptidase Q